jgi:hypothetical protein
MSICPNINLQEWKDLEAGVGTLEAFRDFMETGGEIRTTEQVQAKLAERTGYPDRSIPESNVIVPVEDARNVEEKIRSLDRINDFLENIKVPVELTDFGNTPALAAANFEKGVVQITNKLEDRAEAWNELPEEAAHWWYRLLHKDSAIKRELWDLVIDEPEYQELLNSDEYNAAISDRLSLDDAAQVRLVEERLGPEAAANARQSLLDAASKKVDRRLRLMHDNHCLTLLQRKFRMLYEKKP